MVVKARKPAEVPRSSIRYYGPGQHCDDPALGDLILVRHHGFAASVIRFGERLRLRGSDKVYAAVNHAMTVVVEGPFPQVQEMGPRGGTVTILARYAHLAYAVVHIPGASADQRLAAARVALWYTDVPYGWPSIAGDTLYILTGIALGLVIGQSVVCSTDACSAQRCLGLIPDKADIGVLPSDLARYHDVRIPPSMQRKP